MDYTVHVCGAMTTDIQPQSCAYNNVVCFALLNMLKFVSMNLIYNNTSCKIVKRFNLLYHDVVYIVGTALYTCISHKVVLQCHIC